MMDGDGVASSQPGDDDAERAAPSELLFDDISRRCLTELGIEAGWRCLELSAGSGSITRWLAQQVGSSGEVVAAGVDPRLMRREIFPDNVEIRLHDVRTQALEAAAYDLVHCRDLLSAFAQPLAPLRRIAAAVRPGAWLCIEEYDFSAFGAAESAYPGASEFDQTSSACFDALRTHGCRDPCFGRRLPALLRELRFARAGVSARLLIGEGGGHPLGRWCASLIRSRPFLELVERGIVAPDAFDRMRALVETPGFSFVGPVLVSVWGQRPFFGG